VTLYIGPTKPNGGKAKTWILPDIKKAE